jgi:hypothetical protein
VSRASIAGGVATGDALALDALGIGVGVALDVGAGVRDAEGSAVGAVSDGPPGFGEPPPEQATIPIASAIEYTKLRCDDVIAG